MYNSNSLINIWGGGGGGELKIIQIGAEIL